MEGEIKLVNKCRYILLPLYACCICATYFIFEDTLKNENGYPLYVTFLVFIIALAALVFTIWIIMVGFMKVVIKDNHIKIKTLFVSKEFDTNQITKVAIYDVSGSRGRCERMYLYIDGKKMRLPNPIGEDMKNYRLFYTRIMRLNVPVERVYR